MKLVNIGFGNTINADRLISIVSPEAAPIKRIIQLAKDKNLAIDATCGRKTKSVIILDSSHVVLSALMPDVIAKRLTKDNIEIDEIQEE
ncbi:MAG: DUF370 domain-containing protein [Clostridiales bacterium]|nr:DUF370 domain-containing protein [Clostridiales bacterium]